MKAWCVKRKDTGVLCTYYLREEEGDHRLSLLERYGLQEDTFTVVLVEITELDETKPRVDWEGAYKRVMAILDIQNCSGNAASGKTLALMDEQLEYHTTPPPKPETLEDVVREFVDMSHDFNNPECRKAKLLNKMRELTKGEK